MILHSSLSLLIFINVFIDLFQLKKPLDLATYSNLIMKLELPNSNEDYLDKTVRISGYGRTNPKITEISKDLKYANARVLNNNECQKDRQDKTIYPSEHLCTKLHQHDVNHPEGICKVKIYHFYYFIHNLLLFFIIKLRYYVQYRVTVEGQLFTKGKF